MTKTTSILISATIIILLFSCKEKEDNIEIVKEFSDSTKLESIHYKIRNSFGDRDEEYIIAYHYDTQNNLIEIKDNRNEIIYKYKYLDDRPIKRTIFSVELDRNLSIDSFLYDNNKNISQSYIYGIDDSGASTLKGIRKFTLNESNLIQKTEDYRMPENQKSFIREYSWKNGNIVSFKRYLDGDNRLINIEEFYEYDDNFNYKCLNGADIDIPVSSNNMINMNLNDYLGNYDGVYEIENKIEYNQNGLPMIIYRNSKTVFDIFSDTILINYK